ncbi:MAG: hypothetical protein AB1700_12700 [Bacillota bacterium]
MRADCPCLMPLFRFNTFDLGLADEPGYVLFSQTTGGFNMMNRTLHGRGPPGPLLEEEQNPSPRVYP